MEKTYDLKLPVSSGKKKLLPGKIMDAEKIIRLNPLWIVEALRSENDTFNAEIRDYASDEIFHLKGKISTGNPEELAITFDGGGYASLSIKPAGNVYTADITYINPDFVEESDEERNTVLWLRAIQEYLRLFLKDSLYTRIFRYIMNNIVIKMTPSQRKISLMLVRITIVEVAVILLIVVGYVFFVLKPSGAP